MTITNNIEQKYFENLKDDKNTPLFELYSAYFIDILELNIVFDNETKSFEIKNSLRITNSSELI